MSLFSRVISLGLFLCLATPAGADTLELAPNHPQRYVVQTGDTLWDISARFLRDPWRWKDIWQKNPQIRNPHLIYPGDMVALSYEGGRPVLRVMRNGRPFIKLSPGVRSQPHDGAIPTIPVDAINQFLNNSRVVDAGVLDEAATIVSMGRENLVGATGNRVFATGLREGDPVRYGIYRRSQTYKDTGANKGEVLGYEALHVGDAVIEAFGDQVATVFIHSAKREILEQDKLLPAEDEHVVTNFFPHVPDAGVNGQIIAVVDGVSQIGQHQIVVLNKGVRDGIQQGHVLEVSQEGGSYRDTSTKTLNAREEAFAAKGESESQRNLRHLKELWIPGRKAEVVQLPDQRAGLVMVFRSFDRVSYALVMEATRAMHLHDTVATP